MLIRRLDFEKKELDEKCADFEERLIVTKEELVERISQLSEDLERLRQESREKDEELHILQRKGGEGGGAKAEVEKNLELQ